MKWNATIVTNLTDCWKHDSPITIKFILITSPHRQSKAKQIFSSPCHCMSFFFVKYTKVSVNSNISILFEHNNIKGLLSAWFKLQKKCQKPVVPIAFKVKVFFYSPNEDRKFVAHRKTFIIRAYSDCKTGM